MIGLADQLYDKTKRIRSEDIQWRRRRTTLWCYKYCWRQVRLVSLLPALVLSFLPADCFHFLFFCSLLPLVSLHLLVASRSSLMNATNPRGSAWIDMTEGHLPTSWTAYWVTTLLYPALTLPIPLSFSPPTFTTTFYLFSFLHSSNLCISSLMCNLKRRMYLVYVTSNDFGIYKVYANSFPFSPLPFPLFFIKLEWIV